MLEIRREQDSDKNDVFRIHQDGFQHVDRLRKNSQFNPNLSFVALIDKKIVDFYSRFGFVSAKNYQIRAPFSLDNDDCYMILELKPQALPLNNEEGIVQYLPEFEL